MLERIGKQGGLGLRRYFGRRMARKVGRSSLSRDSSVEVQRARMDHAGDRLPGPKGLRSSASAMPDCPLWPSRRASRSQD